MMAVPMWLLYEAGIIFSRILIRDRAKRQAEKDVAEQSEQDAGDS
jgi:Sec-independent protein secretion pathway component TatC